MRGKQCVIAPMVVIAMEVIAWDNACMKQRGLMDVDVSWLQ